LGSGPGEKTFRTPWKGEQAKNIYTTSERVICIYRMNWAFGWKGLNFVIDK
jgi:hypothetical protein